LVEEIVWQVLLIQRFLRDRDERVSNVVFMGMGEPFLNYDNVVHSVKLLNDEKYFGIGARHIVVSTVGISDKIYEFAKLNLQVRLAISLHASNDKLRDDLMPINKKYNIKSILDATDYFSSLNNKRVTFEYVLIKGVNDGLENAKELADLLKGRLAFVNLLVYNPHDYADFEKPDKKKVVEFRDKLLEEGVECSIRRSMGDDISGACGQLAGERKK
jgi:23S rRNA (adenine2503-C2)-methyltransferase